MNNKYVWIKIERSLWVGCECITKRKPRKTFAEVVKLFYEAQGYNVKIIKPDSKKITQRKHTRIIIDDFTN